MSDKLTKDYLSHYDNQALSCLEARRKDSVRQLKAELEELEQDLILIEEVRGERISPAYSISKDGGMAIDMSAKETVQAFGKQIDKLKDFPVLNGGW